jgi:hypothetical protein
MACRITELVVDARDPAALAGWWAEVLGWAVVGTEDDGSVEIGPPGEGPAGLPTLLFQPVPDPTPGKRRLHLDLTATDRDQDAELARLLALGAVPADVGQTGTESWRVLADPEGNEFCLLAGRVAPLDVSR